MATAHKISIALTGELAGDIEAAVASGDYATTSEVVRDSLRHWKRARSDRSAVRDRLRKIGLRRSMRKNDRPR